jgi:hypothetical protein
LHTYLATADSSITSIAIKVKPFTSANPIFITPAILHRCTNIEKWAHGRGVCTYADMNGTGSISEV